MDKSFWDWAKEACEYAERECRISIDSLPFYAFKTGWEMNIPAKSFASECAATRWAKVTETQQSMGSF